MPVLSARVLYHEYNPKVNEEAAVMPGFSAVHPYELLLTQGALELMYRLKRAFARLPV